VLWDVGRRRCGPIYDAPVPVEIEQCPNCGAPLELDAGRCAFCHVPLRVTPDPAAGPAVAVAEPGEARGGEGMPGDPSAPFAMPVEDVFSIKGRGTVATGKITAGTVRVGDDLVIEGPSGTSGTRCTGVEMFRKKLDVASAGDNVGLLLDGVDKQSIARGDTLRAAP
jgi:hypothetical protein